MRLFTFFALAGLVCAAICVLQLQGVKNILAWRLYLKKTTGNWGARWLVQTQCKSQWLLHGACTSKDVEPPWNILYHIGGNGPWIRKKDGTVEEDIEPPRGCKVEQVHMVSPEEQLRKTNRQ